MVLGYGWWFTDRRPFGPGASKRSGWRRSWSSPPRWFTGAASQCGRHRGRNGSAPRPGSGARWLSPWSCGSSSRSRDRAATHPTISSMIESVEQYHVLRLALFVGGSGSAGRSRRDRLPGADGRGMGRDRGGYRRRRQPSRSRRPGASLPRSRWSVPRPEGSPAASSASPRGCGSAGTSSSARPADETQRSAGAVTAEMSRRNASLAANSSAGTCTWLPGLACNRLSVDASAENRSNAAPGGTARRPTARERARGS